MIVRIATLAIALLGLTAAPARPHGWVLYKSPEQRFSAYYPPGWLLLDPRLLGYDAVNVPRSLLVSGGPVIPENGAQITVGEIGQAGQTMNDAVVASQRSADGPPIIDQTLLTGLAAPDACHTLRQVETYENYGGPKNPILQHVTSYFCEVHGRIFAVTMFYWEGNKDAKMLEGLARDVAMTLRIYK